jgi:hypothetical protein
MPSHVRLNTHRCDVVKADHTSMLAVLTLCACTPPLDQVLQLWDFLLAFGVHLNVLCVIAQLLLMRDDVMSSSRHAYRHSKLASILTRTLLTVLCVSFGPSPLSRLYQ